MDFIREEYATIIDRRDNPSENSYTRYLFDQGIDKILKKVGEETAETIIAAKNGDNAETVGEICDLLYHLLTLMDTLTKEVPIWRLRCTPTPEAALLAYRHMTGKANE